MAFAYPEQDTACTGSCNFNPLVQDTIPPSKGISPLLGVASGRDIAVYRNGECSATDMDFEDPSNGGELMLPMAKIALESCESSQPGKRKLMRNPPLAKKNDCTVLPRTRTEPGDGYTALGSRKGWPWLGSRSNNSKRTWMVKPSPRLRWSVVPGRYWRWRKDIPFAFGYPRPSLL
ncbi:hypothetical protein AnigIFM60653_001478 [Aspergillus niger]|nr:hypothetical protein AnigIFM60653_001478 [Aspergillus niger]